MSEFEQVWQTILTAHVNDAGLIDFQGVETQHAQELDSLVAFIGTFDYSALPDEKAQLAYHANVYNILCLKGVLVHDIPKSLGGLFLVTFFKGDEYQINNKWFTLSAYENDIIRSIEDPRLHVAINCMSASCPKLQNTAFTRQQLDAQLEAATKDFANDSMHVRYEAQTNTVHLSRILKWYREDYPGTSDEELISYLNTYRSQPVPKDADISWNSYDWTVIVQP